jgi:hypothetical protein
MAINFNSLVDKYKGLLGQAQSFVQQNPTPMGFLSKQIPRVTNVVKPIVQRAARTPVSPLGISFQNAPTWKAPLTDITSKIPQPIKIAAPGFQLPEIANEMVNRYGRLLQGKGTLGDVGFTALDVLPMAGRIKQIKRVIPQATKGWEATLINEARKYKNAEDFVKAKYEPKFLELPKTIQRSIYDKAIKMKEGYVGSFETFMENFANERFNPKTLLPEGLGLKRRFDTPQQLFDFWNKVNVEKADTFVQEMEAQVGKPIKTLPQTQPVSVPSDIQSQQVASLKGGAAGKPSNDVIQAFKNWVNARRATKAEGLIKSKEFQDLDSEGIRGVFTFQEGDKTGRYGDVKKYYDTKYDELVKNGVDMNYKQDYLPQLWANTTDEINKVFGKTLSTRPSFTLESLIKNYQTGIDAGLTPRYKTISELVGWYESKANKALADTKFFTFLGENGMLASRGKAMSDWVALDPQRFPARRIKTDEGVFSGVFYAPQEIASMINNYLRTPDPGSANMIIQNIANFVSSSKNRLLSFGIPTTGINFHGFNILARSFLENGPRGALKTAYYMVNPKAAGRYVETNLAKTPQAIKSGLTVSTSEYLSPLEADKLLSKFGKKWNELFEKPLFEQIITAKKLEGWERISREYAKSMPEAEAQRQASKFLNTLYGGINWEELGRDRNLQNIFRIIALTPDWLESNVRLGGNLVKSIFTPKNPTGQAYRKAMTYLIGEYIGMNVINKMTSGHYMYENDPGHTFEIEAGYTQDGQKRYIRPFGTAVDFVRLPVDITIGLLKGDPTPAFRAVGNRLSTIVSPAVHLLGNVNWAGQQIYGKDKYGKEIPPLQAGVNIGSELGTVVGFPAFAGQFLKGVTGQQGLEQTLTQGFELPVRYAGGYVSQSDKPIVDKLAVTGKERYDLAKTLKDQSSFGKKQMERIMSEGRSALDQIIAEREQKKQPTKSEEKIKKTKTKGASVRRKKFTIKKVKMPKIKLARVKKVKIPKPKKIKKYALRISKIRRKKLSKTARLS